MKKILALFLSLLMLASVLVACNQEPIPPTTPPSDDEPPYNAPKFDDIDLSNVLHMDMVSVSETATDYVLLDVAGYGKILIRLFPDVAPETVTNFKKLVSEGFYDGLIFHRVIENFMIQGGDPKGDGTGGSPENVKGEFKNNGFAQNTLSHEKTVVSMARSRDMDSASSQFFICLEDAKYLDGDYAAFGKVVYGMEEVEKMADVPTDYNDKPLTPVVMKELSIITDEQYEDIAK